MNLDIRIPIGLLFTVFGVMLVIFGIVSNPEIYQRSLGVNINLETGIGLLIFGAVMLLLGRKGQRRQRDSR
jgi:multisubunit Na+/H+ antiporter MnhG subunit